MNDIFLPEFTRVPTTNWEFICHVIRQTATVRSASLWRGQTPMLFADAVKEFIIVTNRIGVIQTEKKIEWYHVCRPVKLAQAITDRNIPGDDPWYDLNWCFGHFNNLGPKPGTDGWGCYKCHRYLSKAEILMIKAAILKMRT